MIKEEFFRDWSSHHGGAKVEGIVRLWLNISYSVTKPLSRIGVTPNSLTFLGLIFGILVYLTSNSIWAPIFLVFSLICDGVDGSLALISNKSSKMGAVLDSIVDRFTEIFWVLALYQLGVDIYLLLFVCAIAFTQEYLRARAMGAGLTEITIVTFAERPVRASFIFIALIAFQFEFQILNMVVMIWSMLQLISFLMIVRFIYSKIG